MRVHVCSRTHRRAIGWDLVRQRSLLEAKDSKSASAPSAPTSSSGSAGAASVSVAPSSLLAQPSSIGSSSIPPPNLHFTGWSQKRSHDLTNKVAFVTGGAGGIGRGIVEVLARCGCDVAIIDVNQGEAEAVAARVRSESGRRALVLKADVRSLVEMEAAAAECVKQLGALDICVANAGIVRTGSILTMDEKR